MAALLLAAFAVQAAQSGVAQATPPKSNTLVIPAPASCRSLWPKVKRVKAVDIPQAAKGKGHNGRATFAVTVSPEGEVAALDLVKTSGSEAIDEAVKQRAKTLEYKPAINTECEPTQGKVRVTMQYARFDKDSPGGGLDGYSCGEMLREQDWFDAANADRNALFIPRFAYLITGSMVRMEEGEDLDTSMMDAELEKRTAMWSALVKRCRKAPETPLLDEIDHPAMYRRQVDSR